MKSVLTYNQMESNKEWYNYPTLPSVFKSAGYVTYWCSNQQQKGFYVQNLSAIALTCDIVNYLRLATDSGEEGKAWEDNNAFDGDLLPKLKDYTQVGANLFEVVHLMGSHPIFSKRYPANFQHFFADDIDEPNLDDQKRKKTSEYMNSILYNDYVIKRIIDRYKETSSLVIYFSDHALVRYDNPDQPDFFEHGTIPVAAEIPFMIYMSPKFKLENEDVYEAVLYSVNKPIMSDILSNSLVSLLGIKTNLTNSKFDFWSSFYDESRQRLLRSWNDQDSVLIPPLEYVKVIKR